MATSSGTSALETPLSLLGDSQSVRMAKNWKKDLGGLGLETSCIKSGWTTGELKKAVKENVSFLKDKCFIFIGVNDVSKKVPLKEITKNLSAIIRFLSNQGKRIIIATLPPILNCTSEQAEQIRMIDVYILSFSTHKAVTVVPFHKLFPPFTEPKPDYYQCRYFNGRPDRVHLSPKGLKVLRELIISATATAQ